MKACVDNWARTNSHWYSWWEKRYKIVVDEMCLDGDIPVAIPTRKPTAAVEETLKSTLIRLNFLVKCEALSLRICNSPLTGIANCQELHRLKQGVNLAKLWKFRFLELFVLSSLCSFTLFARAHIVWAWGIVYWIWECRWSTAFIR